MTLTKKDYIVFAEFFKEELKPLCAKHEYTIKLYRFCAYLKNTNPLFNKKLFLLACGIEEN